VAKHFIALDSLRGIAAIMVALHHFRSIGPLDGAAIVRQAWMFVDFFFVLSGFVIAATYRARLGAGFGAGAFLLLRIGRLYPLHLVMLGAFVLTEFAIMAAGPALGGSGRVPFSGQTDPWAILSNLLLVSGLGIHDGLTWNGVAWSVSTEMWTYVAFACLVVLLRPFGGLAGLALAAGGFAIMAAALVLPHPFGRFVDIGRCLHGFGIGCLLFEAFAALAARRAARGLSPGVMTGLEAAALALALAPFLARGLLPPHLLTALAFAPAVFVFAHDGGALSRLLGARPFVMLGLLSYSIYMIHPFVQSRLMLPVALVAQKRLGLELVSLGVIDGETAQIWGASAAGGLALTVAMLAIVVMLSFLAYRWIEAPSRAAMRRYVDARHAPAARAVAR
jgi:peptidoglycan/LPS O-acetylase OafA/YrhL